MFQSTKHNKSQTLSPKLCIAFSTAGNPARSADAMAHAAGERNSTPQKIEVRGGKSKKILVDARHGKFPRWSAQM